MLPDYKVPKDTWRYARLLPESRLITGIVTRIIHIAFTFFAPDLSFAPACLAPPLNSQGNPRFLRVLVVKLSNLLEQSLERGGGGEGKVGPHAQFVA